MLGIVKGMSSGKHLLVYILLPLCLLAIAASYYRFMVVGSYVVEYEGACDPVTESCFVACADDECTDLYYHTWVHKYASDVQRECGIDVTDCEAANVCLPGDTECSVTYCDPALTLEDETCDDLDSSSVTEPEVPEEGVEVIEVDAATTTEQIP